MAITLTVDGTDVTSLVRLDSIAVEMKAYGGEVGSGSVAFDDTTGTANPATPMKEWVLTESTASPTTIAGGYIAERDIDRGPLTVGVQRQFGPVLEDYNAALADRILMGSSARRPEETDYARVQWLLSTGALGHLDGAGHVPNTDTVTLEPANYRGKTPADVLRECAEASNKNYYIYFKSGTGWVLFYDKANATTSAFTSSLQISDVLADIDNSTTFGASDIDYMRDPISIFSTMVVRWRSGWIRETDDDTKDEFRRRDIFRRRTRCRTASAARRWARKQLEKTDEEVQRLTLSVTVPSSALGELRAGMRIQVKIASRGVTSFTYFRIVAATFRPAFGVHATDVMWRVTLIMRDKERLLGGGVGGSGGSGMTGGTGTGSGGTSSGDSGGGGNDGGEEPDDDPSPPGGGVDSGEHILDDWTRVLSSSTPAEISRISTTTSASTSHILAIPDGADVVGRILLLVYVVADPDASALIPLQLTNVGYSLLENFVDEGGQSAALFVKLLDGTEGFPETGATITITSNISAVMQSYAAIIEGVATASDGIDWTSSQAAGADPTSVSGWASQNEIGYAIGFSDVAITGGSYTNRANLNSGGVALRVQQGDLTGAFNPGAFTMTGASAAWTFTAAGRFTNPEWGNIPRGEGVDTQAPWTGGNPYVKVSTGTATVSTDGTHGLIAIGGDNTTVAMVLKSDATDDANGYPWGPWSDGDASLRYLWKVNPVGDTSDSDENILEWQIITEGWRAIFRVNLGDGATYVYQSGGDERGIVIGQRSTITWSAFVPKTIASDTYYMTRLDFRGTQARMKLWAASETEPIAWDIDVPKEDDDADPATDVAQLYLRVYGNTGMTFTFDTSWAQVGGSASGPITEDLPRGDGVTTTWTVGPWVGTLLAFVDNMGPVTLASFDRVAGTFTFDRPPAYGAWISVQYVPS